MGRAHGWATDHAAGGSNRSFNLGRSLGVSWSASDLWRTAPSEPTAPGQSAPDLWHAAALRPASGLRCSGLGSACASGAIPPYGTQDPNAAYGAPPIYGAMPPAYGATAAGYGAPGPYGQFAGPKTSGLAIAGLICSIAGLFFCGVPSIVGLVLSIVGRSQIKKSNGMLKGLGLATAGIIVGIVAIVLYVAFWAWIASRLHHCGDGQYRTTC